MTLPLTDAAVTTVPSGVAVTDAIPLTTIFAVALVTPSAVTLVMSEAII